MSTTGTGELSSDNRISTMVFRQQNSGNVSFAATNMRMHINRSRHYHLTLQVIFFIYRRFFIRGRNNPPVLNIYILFLSINPARRIINGSTCQFYQHISPTSFCSIFFKTSAVAGSPESLNFLSRMATTLSNRYACPA